MLLILFCTAQWDERKLLDGRNDAGAGRGSLQSGILRWQHFVEDALLGIHAVGIVALHIGASFQ
eukprot:2867506-Amphidinium_carterae.2